MRAWRRTSSFGGSGSTGYNHWHFNLTPNAKTKRPPDASLIETGHFLLLSEHRTKWPRRLSGLRGPALCPAGLSCEIGMYLREAPRHAVPARAIADNFPTLANSA